MPRGGQVAIPPSRKTYAEVAASSSVLENATWVYIKQSSTGPPLSDVYIGPYKLLECGEKTCRVQVGEREEIISRDRLKPHQGLATPEAAVPPRRGRPPGSGIARAIVN